jgi:hypothetical protein
MIRSRQVANPAQDNFEQYFTEKLWEMIPGIYRHEDGLAEKPGVLRALVEILAEQAAILRRSHDRLWSDQFIALCQDWAVPYLGDLVATRLVSALNSRGRRVDVAKTIYYRRRKGTPRILEELCGDIAGWEGKVVEEFRILSRFRHGLDPLPYPLKGRYSGTMPGGVADLRDARMATLVDSAFDEYFHTADVRKHSGANGRHNIPKLAFHLYRLRAFPVIGSTPFALSQTGGMRFTCDPSGRDIPLFAPRHRAGNWDEWCSPREWDLPAPIPCRLLADAEYVVTETLIRDLEGSLGVPTSAGDRLRTMRGVRFSHETRLREAILSLNEPSLIDKAVYDEILSRSIVSDCAKAALLDRAITVADTPNTPVSPASITSGDLSKWPIKDPGKRLVIDPERGRLQFFGTAQPSDPRVLYHYGFAGEIGAGTYSRPDVEGPDRTPTVLPTMAGGGPITADKLPNDGIAQIEDNATYEGISDKTGISKMTLQAANESRPYIRLTSNWVLRTPADADAELLLDGIWLGSTGDYEVILRGDYEKVTICHATFDPGGVNDVKGNPIRPVPLVIEAKVEKLVVMNCIMGRIFTRDDGVVEDIEICDSILDATDPGVSALELPLGRAEMRRVTVFGGIDVNWLWSSEALITGAVDVTNTQDDGCFRFSAAPISQSRLPRRYESHDLIDAAHIFTSRQFGQPGYAQLSQTAPLELVRGAENGSEIGAFSGLANPIKLDSLRAKVDEYMPFGLIPIFIQET